MSKRTLTTNGEGKSDLYRKVDRKKYESNWDKIFSKKSKRDSLTYYSKTKKKWITFPDWGE